MCALNRGRKVGPEYPCLLTVKPRRGGGAGRVLVPSGIAGHRARGSAHDAAELEVLKAVARQCVAASQGLRPSDLCLAMAKRDSLLRAVPGWTARQARASKPRRWRAWWLLLHRGRDPVRDRRAARSERNRRRPGWQLAADTAQALRPRRRSGSWAFQRSSDAFCPALDLGPVAVIAEPTAGGLEEQARGQRPLMSLDRASEDPVLTRVNRIVELADLPGLAPHQLADPRCVSPNMPTLNNHTGRAASAALLARRNPVALGIQLWL